MLLVPKLVEVDLPIAALLITQFNFIWDIYQIICKNTVGDI
jgi:hypothetical protein